METFEEIIKGEKPVLVDFYATWCGPCKMMLPIVEQLEKELADTIRVVKIDVDQNEPLEEEYKIKMVPTFILFRNGEAVWRKSGIVDKATLVKEIQSNIE